MKHSFLLLTILLGMAISSVTAHASVLILNYVAAATASDDGPEDGVFDRFRTGNFGSVVDNGYTGLRTATEFELAGIPAHSNITSAVLTFTIQNWEGTRSIAVNGYPGDGTITLGDFAYNDLLGRATLSTGGFTLPVDVTQFVAGLVGQGTTFAGFNFRESPANTGNFLIMHMDMTGGTAPNLTVDYGTMAEPSTVTLLLAGFPFLAVVQRRMRNKRCALLGC